MYLVFTSTGGGVFKICKLNSLTLDCKSNISAFLLDKTSLNSSNRESICFLLFTSSSQGSTGTGERCIEGGITVADYNY